MKAALLIVTAVVALVASAPASAELYTPSDRTIFGGATQSAPIAPDDRQLRRPAPEPAVLVVRRVEHSFDWTDAGVGAASGLGIALVLAGGMLALRRRGVATA